MARILCIVVPCYQEEEVLPSSAETLKTLLLSMIHDGLIAAESRILFVDDGSRDGTWSIIFRLHASDPMYIGLRFGGNAGHQNAVWAGLMEARNWADMAVTIDADLQDDPSAIREMVQKCIAGAGVVCGVRKKRSTDSFLKRTTAQGYYRLLQALGCRIVYNHADFRLMDRAALERLSGFDESHLFLRGMVQLLGRPVDYVYYDRQERKLGKSKYTVKKMIDLAADGITGLSAKPLRLIGFSGIACCIVSVLLLVFSIVSAYLGYPFWNWKIVSVLLLLVGGLILIGMGILGEYIGRIYDQTRHRPKYYIEEILK